VSVLKSAAVIGVGALSVTLLAAAPGAGARRSQPGPEVAVTSVGYRITPAGRQTRLGDLPLALAMSPDASMLIASNDGEGLQSLQVIDPATGHITQHLDYTSPAALFRGLAFSPDGSRLYAAGGGDETVHTYQVLGGRLVETPAIRLLPGLPELPKLPGSKPDAPQPNDGAKLYPGGLAVTPDGRRLVVTDLLGDSVSVVDLTTSAVRTIPAGHRPAAVAITSDGGTAWVSDEGGDNLTEIRLSGEPAPVGTVRVGTHPLGMTLDRRTGKLWVADADSDQLSVVDTARRALVATVDLTTRHHGLVGMTPVAPALSPDGTALYVADSGGDAVSVIDARSAHLRGAIPVGWYPSAVVATTSHLFVANAKGYGSGPNDFGNFPEPVSAVRDPESYVGAMIVGTLSTISAPIPSDQLEEWTAQVAADSTARHRSVRSFLPPIKHVVYLVQENRTFDQVLGSLGKGDGDPTLDLFEDGSAPNQRELSYRYVTFDNFYADAEVSAQGWNWTVAANSNPYTEHLWPANYSARKGPYPSESGKPEEAPNRDPKDAYIWDRLADAHVSFRNYGFYVSPDKAGAFHAVDPVLDANTDHAFRAFDLNCPDNADTFQPRAKCGVDRIDEWRREYAHYEATDSLPTVELMRLPNDHTSGTKPGMPTPRSYVADNDLALGKLVETVTHSRDWASTAIFVTEDDAQNGPDHVDAHRTLALLISPWTHTGAVDSTFYSTASMLATIEDVVGIGPMTRFDAFATPMTAAFVTRPDLTPYRYTRPPFAGEEANTDSSPLAAISARQRLDVEDQIDPQTFNEAIWQSIRGPRSPMPAPRHRLAAMPVARAGGDGDDD
jgi:YVTN family beta-propeller protein